jgi:5-methylcytosine-specific restriction endonuclease McrA
MKNYVLKRTELLIKQHLCCASCGKKFTESDKIELAHRVKASKGKNGNYKKYGEDVIDHVWNLAATHPGKCNDKQNMSRAAHPIESMELITSIQQSIMNK